MGDIAVLGLALDSRPVVQGTKALDDFARSSKPAAAGAAALEKAVSDAGKASGTLGTKLKPANDALTNVAKSGALARHELINLSRQIQDVGVSLVSGQSPFMVLAQQGAQVADIFGSSKTGTVGGALKQVGSGIANFLTPVRALSLGVAAAGAAGYAFYSSWHTATLQLDDTARSIGVTTGQLSKLQAASSFKGISADDFTKGITSFAQSVYDAKNNMGGLAEVFQANNVRAGDFTTSLGRAADLIKNARNDQQRLVLLQQMGLPATMQWVRLLSGGADGLKKAQDAAAEFAANDNLVASARRFDEAWNRGWTNFGLNARSAFQKAMETGGGFLDRMERLAQQAGNSSIWDRFLPSNHADVAKGMGIETLSPFQQRFAGDSKNPAAGSSALADGLRGAADRINNKTTVDPNALARDIALQQQRLGLLGQVATVNEQVRATELQIAAARMQPGNKITDADVARIRKYAEASTLGTLAIRSQADAYRVEASTIGMSVGAATEYYALQTRINDERRKGNELSPLQIAALKSEASALGQAAERTETLRFGYEGLVRGPLQTFRSSIMDGASGFDALKKAGVSALDAVSSRLMDMASQKLWQSAFGGSSFSLGSLFGGGGSTSELPNFGTSSFIGPTLNHTGYGPGDSPGPTRIVPSIMFDRAPRFHTGIGSGERAAIIRNDESVLTPGQMGQLAPVDQASGVRDVNVVVRIDENGNLQAFVEKVAQQATAAGITGYVGSKDFVNNVGAANRKAIGRRVG
ncbi:phage tail length tape measure family protein [Tardiphaga sp. 841_E9_N1_2]|uniref:phage tail length tape measure family protein n=1 Tax=Tardiphaga sp. 841_E9_N1_2 TaxID=3240762 RepID=UPI003F254418